MGATAPSLGRYPGRPITLGDTSMGKVLSAESVESYRRDGFLPPIGIFRPAEARMLRGHFEAFEAEHGKVFSENRAAVGSAFTGSYRFKSHLLMKWLADVIRHPKILDAVEDLIGPDILAFASKFWIKGGDDGAFVSWHQDSAYFGCDPHDMVTCWLALTPANKENGCMRAMPGSHEIGHDHDESYENAPGLAPGEKKNMLGRGQNIPGLDESKAVHMELEQGQFSIHKERTAHASFPNNSGKIRIGYSFFLIPPHVKSVLERRPATLVRGVDEHGHYDPEPAPDGDATEAAMAAHRDSLDRFRLASESIPEMTGIH